MLENKDYCDYDTCVALKELGYKGSGEEGCRHGVYEGDGINYFYDDLDNSKTIPQECLRVHVYSAQKFLREEHNLHIEIASWPSCWTGKIYDLKKWDYIKGFTFFKSFEETLHTLIKEAVKILKEK